MQQNILLLQHRKEILALGHLGNAFRQACDEYRKFKFRTRHLIGDVHQPHQIDGAIDAVDVDLVQLELRGEKLQGFLRTIVRDFQTHRITQMPLR